jgi:hypothetical protein
MLVTSQLRFDVLARRRAFVAHTFLAAWSVCVRFLRGSVADTTGSRRTLLTKNISHGRSQFKVHTDERTQVHSAQPSLAVTHPSTNRDRRNLTLMNKSPS